MPFAQQAEHHAWHVRDNGAKTRFILQQFEFGSTTFPAQCGLAQFAFDRRHQAGEITFHHIIMGARVHGTDGNIFADIAGVDDERHIREAAVHDFQRFKSAELRHGVVGDHHIPLVAGQRLFQRIGCKDTAEAGFIATPTHFMQQQFGVVFRVLDQ